MLMLVFWLILVADLFKLAWVNLCVHSLLCRYHLQDVIVGKVYFVSVSLNVMHMEIQLLKTEVAGLGTFSIFCIL